MSKKEILCESCDGVFKIQHDQEEHYYKVKYCPFCGDELNSDNEYDIIEFNDADEWE